MSAGTRLTTEAPARVDKHTFWQIDPHHSFVEFAIKHMLFTTVKSRFTGIHGTDSSRGWSIFVALQLCLIFTGVWYFRQRGLL